MILKPNFSRENIDYFQNRKVWFQNHKIIKVIIINNKIIKIT